MSINKGTIFPVLGKIYLARGGFKVRVTKNDPNALIFPLTVTLVDGGDDEWYTVSADGCYYKHRQSVNDLVAEV